MRTLVGVVVVAGMLALSGCVEGDAIPTLPPTPTATPLFASEEEALAAAEEAYRAYQSAVDEALRSVDATGLDRVATGEALDAANSSVEDFRESGRFQVGDSTIDSVTAADLSSLLGGEVGEVAQIYACLDLSQVAVSDASGSTTQSAVTRLPMLVGLVEVGDVILVSEEEVWDASNFCI